MRLQLALRVGLGELDPAVCGLARRALHRAVLEAVRHVVHGARRRVAAAPGEREGGVQGEGKVGWLLPVLLEPYSAEYS